MSIQPFVDPHIGRCKNIRPSNDGENDTSRRCLEMDGHQSACRFRPQPPRPIRGFSDMSIYRSITEPKPWVVPE